MKEATTAEFPGWTAEVHEAMLSKDHVVFQLGTRLPKAKLDEIGPDFIDKVMKALTEIFKPEEVPPSTT